MQVGTNFQVSDLAYAGDIMLLSNNYREMQGLFEAANRHGVAVSMHNTATKTKVMLALIPGELSLDDELLENVDKFKYAGLMLVAKARASNRSEAGLILPAGLFLVPS